MQVSTSGDRLHYDVVTVTRTGLTRVHRYAADDPLAAGDVIPLDGRYWLVEKIDTEEPTPRVVGKPARYRLVLRHPDGHEERGAFRRFRPGSPTLGHALTTEEDGRPISWEVADAHLAFDEQGEPYVELVAERDFAELEELPDHELEHTLARRLEDEVPESAAALFERAEREGLAVELVAVEPGAEPDWAAAGRFIDALVIEEIADDLIEQCGVDPDADPRETWLARVQERLRDDLARFRGDVEGDHDQIEEWGFRRGRILASVGTLDDESDPDSGHGWMCRLVDSDAIGAAGFTRIQKARLDLLDLHP